MRNAHNFALLAVLLVGLAGCADGPATDEASATQVFPFVRLAPSGPPQKPYEEKLPPEEPMKQVWRAGYWDYDGTTFIWVPGHYLSRPDPTASWTPDRWEQRAFGWAFVPGFWQ